MTKEAIIEQLNKLAETIDDLRAELPFDSAALEPMENARYQLLEAIEEL